MVQSSRAKNIGLKFYLKKRGTERREFRAVTIEGALRRVAGLMGIAYPLDRVEFDRNGGVEVVDMKTGVPIYSAIRSV